jgi:hypothetical protein
MRKVITWHAAVKVATNHLDEPECDLRGKIRNELRNLRLNDEPQSSNSEEFTKE